MNSLLSDNFEGLQHIGIPVTDIDRSRAFYQRLGFVSVMERTIDEADGEVLAAMMRREAVIIELYQLPEARRAAFGQRRDGAIDHIAFSVTDIDRAFRELSEAGETIIEEAPVHLDFWRDGCRYFAIRGPDGEKLEFNQIL